MPEIPIKILGHGPLEGKVSEQAAELPNLTYLGQDSERVKPELQASLGCVVPSVWEEPAGLVSLEAMAAGTPVIATDVGGIPEYVGAAGCGFVVPPGAASLVDGCRRLIAASDEQWLEFSRNGRAAVEARHTPAAYVEGMMEIYKAAVGQSASAGVTGPGASILSRMHVQLWTAHFEPQRSGIAPLMGVMARALAESGLEVSVVAAHPFYPDPSHWQRRRLPTRTVEDGIPVTRLPIYSGRDGVDAAGAPRRAATPPAWPPPLHSSGAPTSSSRSPPSFWDLPQRWPSAEFGASLGSSGSRTSCRTAPRQPGWSMRESRSGWPGSWRAPPTARRRGSS